MKTLNTQNSATHASKNEGGIIHEIINLNDAITNSVESVLGVRIAKKTKRLNQAAPLFRCPTPCRKTKTLNNAIAAAANMATATACRIWLQNHIQKANNPPDTTDYMTNNEKHNTML